MTAPHRIDHAADVEAIARIAAVPTILRVVSESTGLRFVLVARVTDETWTCCAVLDRMNFGLGVGGHLDVATTLCSEVRDSHQPIVIEHASQEPDYCDHPTPKLYGLESYIAVPIFRKDGTYFGNLCGLDSAPARLRDEKTLPMMRLFADLIETQLMAEEEAERDREALREERRNAELREQFIAVLGHDLRNPVFAVLGGSSHLLSLPLEPVQRRVLERIRSGGERMARLIDDVMDFARGRLGGGMPIARDSVDLGRLANDVVGEIVSANPDRVVRVDTASAGSAHLDASRVAQMLSNLVANATQHGDPAQPVDVAVTQADGMVRFAVTNRGTPIPEAVRARLFQPFVRQQGGLPTPGLGLGLYIASEIARAHGGSIAADSTGEGVTSFVATLRAE
jgi:signal transduction histidine kinase